MGARDNRTPAGGDAHPSACSARNRGRKASPEWTRRDLDPDLRFARATCCQVAPRAHVDVRRRSRTCSAPRGLRVSTPVRCRSASRTERRSRCPPYASFWFRRHCTKRRISDLLPRGLAVSPVPPRASRSLDHPPWRRCRFKCGCPASRPPGLRRAACVVERGRSSAAVVATVSHPRAPGH